MKEPSEKLKAKWNRKLADSGFQDIERADGSLKPEVDYRSLDSTRGNNLIDGRQEYYYTAQDFLNRGKFTSLLDYTVWKLHAEGMSYRTIGKELNLTFYKVNTIIKKVQHQAGIKK
jgi:Mor family transcriptional regulator